MDHYDVIIIGGSYSGLAAAMALGRALKNVLIIDNGDPGNKQTPYSHNFLTQDGHPPFAISSKARMQVEKYQTVSFLKDKAIKGVKIVTGYKIETEKGEAFTASKLIFASGIKDILPSINGIEECWGISVLHCPYCHGYEVKNETTGIIGNDVNAFDLTQLISNWTQDLTLYTNGPSKLSIEQTELLCKHMIKVDEHNILELVHSQGQIKSILFTDGSYTEVKAIYVKAHFEQHCSIPISLGCEINKEGYLVTDGSQETTVKDVYACGDNSSRMRTIANAVGTGTTAGIAVSKSIIVNNFKTISKQKEQ
ncbi:MAG: NAD(P)/FAD-dependent oxidoreductase [Sporocytophaga sp.]|uniref:NAD(P)/FAD-dependent oxidoreductase n=1 Tax=Sporocytophaga sp. TaxID=2231183 RepID=UPI001B2BB194|nr:NAD(P)/FAD-dependent oxidoreductase [Sporocytophaga sp.]MBO9701138.1 NAD(P)/FAD-dependent oxidoreductase [Sporocytophaga sp.]